VRFTDCDFVCDIDDAWDSDSQSHNFAVDKRGNGIIMEDSYVTIQKSTSGPGCSFRNLNHALLHRRFSAAPTRFANVTDATFDNCMRSVTLEGGSNDRIRNSIFKIPSTVGWHWAWGVYGINGRTYTMTDNTLTGIDGSGTTAWGNLSRGTTWANGPLLDPTTTWIGYGGNISENHFSDLAIGSQTEQWNPYLKLRCNDYTTTDFAWAINPGSSEEPAGYGGYLGPQGTGCDEISGIYRAGNLFNDGGDHIWSWAYPEKYYAAGGINTSTVPNINTGAPNIDLENCDFGDPDNSCSSSGGITFHGSKSKKADLDAALTALGSERSAALTGLDGGNTASMLVHIADSTYSTSTLTTDLLGPALLSDTVLKAACQRYTFFHENAFTQIIIKNSPLSYPVWKDVVEYGFPKIKVFLRDSITDAQATDSVRTLEVMRREIMAARNDHFETVNDILGLYVEADSIPALIHYLADSLATKEYKKLAVGTALSYDTISWARAILDSLELENANDSVFYEFEDLAVSLAGDTLTWFALDSGQLVRMWELAESEFDIAIHAQAVLGLVLDTVFERTPEPMIDGPFFRRDEESTDEPVRSLAVKNIKVYPNPFSNSFNVEYALEQETSELTIEVFDLVGRNVRSTKLSNVQSGKVTIDLNECLGIYLLRMMADGKQIHNQKVVCLQH
jgi:hypothetical protein